MQSKESIGKLLGLLGLILTIGGILGGFLVGWRAELLGLPILNLGLGIIGLGIWVVSVLIPSLTSSEGDVLRNLKASSSVSAYLVAVVASVAIVNVIVANLDVDWDVTLEQVHSLSSETENTVKELKERLDIILLKVNPNDPNLKAFQRLMEKLTRLNNLVSVTTVDPEARPDLVKQYNLTRGDVGLLTLEKASGKRDVKLQELSEVAFLGALKKLLLDRSVKIFITQGHGEPDLEGFGPEGVSKLIKALKDEGFVYNAFNPLTQDKVPSEAGAVLILSPTVPFQERVENMFKDYLKKGGRLLIASNPLEPSKGSLNRILSVVGIQIRDDIVIDPPNMVQGGLGLFVNNFGFHPVASGFDKSKALIIFNTSSLDIENKSAVLEEGGVTVAPTKILSSSERSWGEVSLRASQSQEMLEVKYDQGIDFAGPLTLVAGLDYTFKDKKEDFFSNETRVVVFGGLSPFLNGLFDLGFNSSFIIKAINWLLAFDVETGIRPKSLKKVSDPIPNQVLMKYLTIMLFLPQLILVLGFTIDWFRRKS
jgi:hypothetical protein